MQKQAWGYCRAEKTSQWGAKPIQDLCCIRQVKTLKCTDDAKREQILSESFSKILSVVPNSALAKHVRGRNINRIEFHSGISARSTGPVISICTKDELRLLISHCDTITQPALSLDNVFLAPGHKLFYDEAVKTTIDQVLEIGLETSSQDTKIWKLQRAKRITASSCYGLYTYSKNPKANWDTKIKRYLNPVSFENKSTRFGKDTEDTAFLCYLKKRNPNMKKTGFIIHHYESWIGGSPDGVDPISRVVLEIKCPTGGQEHGLEYLTTKCNATQRYVKVTSANEEKEILFE
ncbi:uncharacterized protein LOC134206882 [Armigeres subalbatus]|uniref:uncharacterized protein LOC134206882 n=1 Tax=Armigeres subalbatus TaxID=124917 RepID=UPI002ED24472